MSEQLDLRGKVALVTGAARGIGRAVSEEMVRLGAQVVAVDNGVAINGTQPDAAPVTELARALGANCAALSVDIAAPGAAEDALRLAHERFGALDFVVNAAAILREAMMFKLSAADFDEVLRVNLSGTFRVIAAATPMLRDAVKAQRAPGRIVNMISSTGVYGNLGTAAYAASKAGMLALTRVSAMELARSGVTCNAIAPFAATRVTESIPPATPLLAQYKQRAQRVPASAVARLTCYLCSPMAQHISGQLFGVRGRELMLYAQARPLARVVVPDDAYTHIARVVGQQFVPQFTDLSTDLESFNVDPIV